jgi:Flp pilus assembly protein TadG
MKLILHQEGIALLEFALALPFFMLICVGFVDMDIYIHRQCELTEAAATGASYGAIPGNQKNLAGMVAAATLAAPDVANLIVSAAPALREEPSLPAQAPAHLAAAHRSCM